MGQRSPVVTDPPCQLRFLQFTDGKIHRPQELSKISLKSKGQTKVLLLTRSPVSPPLFSPVMQS